MQFESLSQDLTNCLTWQRSRPPAQGRADQALPFLRSGLDPGAEMVYVLVHVRISPVRL